MNHVGRNRRQLLALNHFANPLDAPGGTRLIELTERLDGWDTTIVAAGRNLFTREQHASAPTGRYRAVWTTPYGTNGATRMINWASFAIGALLAGLRAAPPDVVYASSPHLLTGVSGWLLARRFKVPFVLEVRDLWPQVLVDTGRLDPTSSTYRAVKRLELFLYRHADTVVALTDGVARYIADEGVPPARVQVIPNGADPADFVTTTARETLRARYGFDGVTFVYAGAHGPANGLDFVLDAAAELAVEVPEAHFVLVGDGLSKPRLEQRARQEHLGSVVFLEPIPKSEMPDLLAASDVGLHVLDDLPLFLYGVSPNKLFDYMAAGRPVLTNTGGEVGELVKGNDAGVAVAPSDLAGGIRQLVRAGPDRREAWGANGRAFMAAHRSRTRMAARLQGVLDRVVLDDHERPSSTATLVRRAWAASPDVATRTTSIGRVVGFGLWRRTIRTPWTIRLPVGGAVIRCYADDAEGAALLAGDTDDLAFVDWWIRSRPGSLVVDHGAGIGSHAMVAAAAGARVIAIEPNVGRFLRLIENIDLNAFGSLLTARPDRPSVDVAVSAIVPSPTVSLLRVDARDEEIDVLTGARETIERDRPALLVVTDEIARMAPFLDDVGYRVVRYDADRGALTPATLGRTGVTFLAIAVT